MSRVDFVSPLELSCSKSGDDGGVGTSDGDGTVPLESLGFPCAALWRGELATHYNPSGSRVVLREHGDELKFVDLLEQLNIEAAE